MAAITTSTVPRRQRRHDPGTRRPVGLGGEVDVALVTSDSNDQLGDPAELARRLLDADVIDRRRAASIVSVAPSASPKAVIHAVLSSPSIAAAPTLATEPVSRLDALAGHPNIAASASSDARRSTRISAVGVMVRSDGELELADQRRFGVAAPAIHRIDTQPREGERDGRGRVDGSQCVGRHAYDLDRRRELRDDLCEPHAGDCGRGTRCPASDRLDRDVDRAGTVGNVDRLPGRGDRFVGQLDALRQRRRTGVADRHVGDPSLARRRGLHEIDRAQRLAEVQADALTDRVGVLADGPGSGGVAVDRHVRPVLRQVGERLAVRRGRRRDRADLAGERLSRRIDSLVTVGEHRQAWRRMRRRAAARAPAGRTRCTRWCPASCAIGVPGHGSSR